MHLVGQHSNPSELLQAVLGWVPEASSVRGREPVAALPTAKRLGNGVVQRAVINALAVDDRPMSVSEVWTAVEGLLGHSVSKDSVSSCLSTGARRGEPRFERLARGLYRIVRAP
jgi:hypothetical protein